MRVDWSDVGPVRIPKPKALAALAAAVLKAEGRQGLVNLVFCQDSEVRRLNRQFRNLDKVTDVLSFHYGEEDEPGEVWGEIYIASLQAQKQAPRWKNTFFNELRRLVVHGALHLAGYDHLKASERLIMRAREDHYLTHGK
jgi:probable rRNA maturation factor